MYTLYSLRTPNGIKPTIMLEELNVPYDIKKIDISKGEQFNPDFLQISPNNKIPVLYDQEKNYYLFESVAILEYLAEKHQQFLPFSTLQEKFDILKWCYFQVAHVGPMFGQYGHFHRYAPEQVPYAQTRYADEVFRLMGVMDKQLFQYQYISGDHYTIADMAIWPWLFCYEAIYQGTFDREAFPHLARWYDHVGNREAVRNAVSVYENL